MTTTTSEADDDLVTVYVRQWKTLRSILGKRTGSQDLADEALQETWQRLLRVKETGEPIRNRQALILRIAGNIATDIVRRERRYSSRFIGDDVLMASIADSYPSPEVFAIDRDRLRQLVRVLMTLPEKARAVLLMNRCDDLAYSAIGAKLGISESMVAKYMAQALRHCRDHLRAE